MANRRMFSMKIVDTDAFMDNYSSFEEFCEVSHGKREDEDMKKHIQFKTLATIEDCSIDAAQKFLCIEALFFYPELFCHLGKVDAIAKAINDNQPLDGNKHIFMDVLGILQKKFEEDESERFISRKVKVFEVTQHGKDAEYITCNNHSISDGKHWFRNMEAGGYTIVGAYEDDGKCKVKKLKDNITSVVN